MSHPIPPRFSSARTCACALALAAAACTPRGETEPPTSASASASAKAKASTKAEEVDSAGLQTSARRLLDASAAIREGALDRGAEAFAPGVVWEIRGVTPHKLRGRENLRADWSERDVTAVNLSRIFLAADDLLIGQGELHAGSRVFGLVLFARVEEGEIVEVLEHLAPMAGEREPATPGDAELLEGERDAVREVMAAVLDQAWTTRDWRKASRMFSEGFAYHNIGAGIEARGMDAYREFFRKRTVPFPDMSFETLRQWQMGDYVVLEKQIRGTHTAPLGDLAPTGRSFTLIGVDVFRFVDESIVELWSYYDPASIQEQIRQPSEVAAPVSDDDDDDE